MADTIKSSDYNDIRALLNQEPIQLKDDEVLIVSNYDENGVVSKYIKNVGTVDMYGKTYHIKNDTPIKENVTTANTKIFFYIVIPNNFKGSFGIEEQMIDFVVTGNKEQRVKSKEKLEQLMEYYQKLNRPDEPIFINGETRDQFRADAYGSGASIIFVGIYLGLVFLISSVAVLALQQLSEASDSYDRYQSLKKIGATKNMIQKAILAQIMVYFILPLALSIMDAFVGIKVIGQKFNSFHLSLFNGISLIAMLIFVFIFGGYLYATYTGYKNVVGRDT
jgi:putative ABC transport system permease protein